MTDYSIHDVNSPHVVNDRGEVMHIGVAILRAANNAVARTGNYACYWSPSRFALLNPMEDRYHG